jgi:hypothetical protein
MGQSPFDRLSRALENFLFVFLGIVTVLILSGAIFLMLQIDNSQSQGTRYYIAIAALVFLGAVDSQFGRLIKRRLPFSLTTTPEEQRYGIISLLFMFVFAVVLIGLAWLLP